MKNRLSISLSISITRWTSLPWMLSDLAINAEKGRVLNPKVKGHQINAKCLTVSVECLDIRRKGLVCFFVEVGNRDPSGENR